MENISEKIKTVYERLADAKERAKRDDEIILMGVTKFQSAETINKSIEAGIKVIGENRVQELLEKYGAINKSVDIHLIGHLQTNKVKYIIDKVSLIHSVESIALMDEINKRALKINKIQDILIEVNVSGEETKFGVSIHEIEKYLEYAKKLGNIRVMGLMTIAPAYADEEEIRKVFRKLYEIFIDIKTKKYDNVYMEYLSMGMSNDFEIAIEEGANIVRVGSAIYGKRIYN